MTNGGQICPACAAPPGVVCRRPSCGALAVEARLDETDRLRAALAEERDWHEAQGKALSKSGRRDTDALWMRLQHRERADAIGTVLAGNGECPGCGAPPGMV